jgi:hypothetical protein
MKKTLHTLLFILSVGITSAQQSDKPQIEEGPLFKVDKRSVPTRFVGFDDSGFYIEYAQGKHGQGTLMLQKFSHDLTPTKSQPLSFKAGGGYSAESLLIFKLDNKIYSCARSGMMDFKDFYLQEIDPLTLEKKSPVKIASVTPETRSAASVSSRFAFSPDSSFLSFIYSIPTKRTESERFGVKMYNRDMSGLWDAEYEFPYQNKLFDPQKYLVNSTGDLFILAKRYIDKRRERVEGQANYDFVLLEMKKDGSLDSVLIQSEGKFLRGMNIAFSPNGDIIAGGFYSELGNAMTGGAYYMRLDAQTRKVVTASFKPFDLEFFTANLTERKAERLEKKIEDGKDVELPFYFIDEFITRDNGSLQMIGEKRLINTVTTCTPYGCVTNTYYYFDDIALVQITPEGEIEWASRVAKKQHTTNDNAMLSSYATLIRPNETVLFFNDNAKNESYDGVGRVTAMAKGTENLLVMVRVDDKGEFTRKGLIKQGDADIRFRPKFSQQLNDDEILIFGHQGVKTQRFFRVKFSD